MKKWLLCNIFYLLMFGRALSANEGVVGFWKTYDDGTKKPQSIIAVYEYQGKVYGRIIATYDDNGEITESIYQPKSRAPGVKGHPYYAGLDILWGLEKGEKKYTNGKVIDPEKGKTYNAEMWRNQENLIMRGELFIFGKNETWPPAQDSDFSSTMPKPDLTKFVPKIPEVK